jgi:hypothetical protein
MLRENHHFIVVAGGLSCAIDHCGSFQPYVDKVVRIEQESHRM